MSCKKGPTVKTQRGEGFWEKQLTPTHDLAKRICSTLDATKHL